MIFIKNLVRDKRDKVGTNLCLCVLSDFYNILRGISAKVKDGHLKIIPNGKDQDYPYYQQGLFPLELYFFNTPLKAVFIDSVAPDVKIICCGLFTPKYCNFIKTLE